MARVGTRVGHEVHDAAPSNPFRAGVSEKHGIYQQGAAVQQSNFSAHFDMQCILHAITDITPDRLQR